MNQSLKITSTPLNANERYLHGILVRQNIIIEQLSSLVEHLSTKDKVAVTDTVVEEVTPKRTRTRKVKEATE